MNQAVKVHLTKLFLWVEPPRFQAWPELLLRLDSNATYPTTASVAKAAFGFQPDQEGNVKFDEVVFNLPGWEKPAPANPSSEGLDCSKNVTMVTPSPTPAGSSPTYIAQIQPVPNGKPFWPPSCLTGNQERVL